MWNIVIENLALPFSILEIPGSYHSADIAYTDPGCW